jgi:hypothetical protein
MSPVTDSNNRSPNNEGRLSSQKLVKISSHHTQHSDRQRINSTYSEETYNSHALNTLEPAKYSHNPFRYSSGPSNSSTLYNSQQGNSIMIDGPLPSPPNKKDIFAMTPTLENSLTPRASSSILTTAQLTRDNSPNGSQTWQNN